MTPAFTEVETLVFTGTVTKTTCPDRLVGLVRFKGEHANGSTPAIIGGLGTSAGLPSGFTNAGYQVGPDCDTGWLPARTLAEFTITLAATTDKIDIMIMR